MINLFWLFIGAVVGMLLVSVFTPPNRNIPTLPTPDNDNVFKTPNGCVKFIANEVECNSTATSLNFIASQHK
jgi:hypothetical protein